MIIRNAHRSYSVLEYHGMQLSMLPRSPPPGHPHLIKCMECTDRDDRKRGSGKCGSDVERQKCKDGKCGSMDQSTPDFIAGKCKN